jgi:hypothetical protein
VHLCVLVCFTCMDILWIMTLLLRRRSYFVLLFACIFSIRVGLGKVPERSCMCVMCLHMPARCWQNFACAKRSS